jgi:hypothetical protein
MNKLSVKLIRKPTLLLALILFINAKTASGQISLRGSHNNWSAEPMLNQGYYSAQDIVTFSNCEFVQFKFDIRGDWSENYGDSDNVRGWNPSLKLMEGGLDRDGGNIYLPCGKTYFLSMSYGHPSYGFRELNREVPDTLAADEAIRFRKAVRGGGQYASVSITGELLVRELPEDRSIIVRAMDSQGQEQEVLATLSKNLGNGVQIWKFAVGSYGSIELQSITYTSARRQIDVEIVKELVQ